MGRGTYVGVLAAAAVVVQELCILGAQDGAGIGGTGGGVADGGEGA